jgi:hypothetical protein
MPKNDNSYKIERFGDRVLWMGRHLQKNYMSKLRTEQPSEIYDAIIKLRMERDQKQDNEAIYELGTKKTWQRCIYHDHAVPYRVVKGLLDIFPELTEDMVICPAYADFELKTEALKKHHSRWKAAVEYMAKDRATLAAIAKRYYTAAGVDEAPNFPLVMRKDWIIPKPIVMNETSPAVTFILGDPAPKVANLDGMNIDYVDLKARNTGRRPYNGDCFRLMDIRRVGDALEFDFQDTCYFDYINTCEILGVELSDQYLNCTAYNEIRNSSSWIPNRTEMPRRGAPQRVFDFSNRAAFLGVNCLLMIRNYSEGDDGQKRNIFYFHDRGESTLEAQNTLHVVPAGGHQPYRVAFRNNETDASIQRTAVREFCEELFNKEEMAEAKATGGDLLESKEIRGQIKAFIKSKAAKFFLLGVGLDPLTTKLEALVAIVVDWPTAQRNGGRDDLEIKLNYEGEVIEWDLSRKALKEILERPYRDKKHPNRYMHWLPAGRACIELALQHYDFLMGDNA